jgi:hypothetical protein
MKQFLSVNHSVNHNGAKEGDIMKRSIVRIGLGIVMGGLLWGGLPANPAVAGLVTFNFTGAVSHVSTPLFPALKAGQTLTGSFTYDTSIADSNGSGNIGRYNDAVTSMNVNLGSFAGTLGSESPGNNNFVRIVNSSTDTFDVRAPLTGSLVGSYEPLYFRVTLKDPSGTVFGDTSLPTTAPSLSSFATDRFRIVFENGSGIAKVRGSLTALTAVPLPPAVILFGAGLIALVGLGAGSWRKRNNTSPSLA